MTSSNTTHGYYHHFMNVKSYYDQNPHKAHFSAGFAAITTGSTGMVSWLAGRPMPKIAKLAVFGLTFVSNLVAFNMQDISIKEGVKVLAIGKKIIDETKAAVTSGLVELYDSIVDTPLEAAEDSSVIGKLSTQLENEVTEQLETHTLGELADSADNN